MVLSAQRPYSATRCKVQLSRKRAKSESVIAWITITYRSVAIAILVLVLLIAAVVYLVYPESKTYTSNLLVGALDRAVGNQAARSDRFAPGRQQAHFTAIDGKVKVKKADSDTDKLTRVRSEDHVGIFGRLVRFLREVVAELRKVIWPTRKELLTYATVVVIFVAVITTMRSPL